MNTYYRTAEAMGIAVVYDARVSDLTFDGRRVVSITVESEAGPVVVRGRRSSWPRVAAFEANIEWLRRYWGDAVDNYIIRGTPYNDGIVFAKLLERDAATAGDPKGFHAIGVDARSPHGTTAGSRPAWTRRPSASW